MTRPRISAPRAILDGKRAVICIIFRQPGANIIQTVDNIKAQLPFLEAVLPQGITTTIVLDRTTTIRASVADRRKHAHGFRRAGHPGGLRLPAQSPRHAHSQCCCSGLAHRHFRRDVRARLQPRQFVSDGAHHRHGFRGRRRHRGDGEHHAPSRKRHAALQRRAGGRARDRLYRISPSACR